MDHPGVHGHFRSGAVDWARLAARQEERRWIVDACWEMLGRPAHRTLADIGCGPGRMSLHFAQLGADVLAVDLRPDAIAQVPPHPRIRTLVHDIEAAPLPEAVDVAVLVDVSHHVRPDRFLPDLRAQRVLIVESVGEAGPPAESQLDPPRVQGRLREAGFAPGPPTWLAPDVFAVLARRAKAGPTGAAPLK